MTSQSDLWAEIQAEARAEAAGEPLLAAFLEAAVLAPASLVEALAGLLAEKLGSPALPAAALREELTGLAASRSDLGEAIQADLLAVRDRDPACASLLVPLLYFKGFHAVQAYRFANGFWTGGRQALARFLQNRISQVFGVDIHPAARIGRGIFVDHGTGVVVGETAVIEDDVSLLQDVTLGGTGKESGDRHPKVQRGVLISAGAKVLGNIEIGEGAKIGAGSVVLKDVPPHTTAVGVPARIVGAPEEAEPALAMDQSVPTFGGEGI